jgi:uncharacterized membrane protein YbhN (UPF0104 family)
VKKYARLFISVALLGVLVWRQRDKWDDICHAFAQLNLSLWLLAVGVYISVQVVSAVRWRMLGRVQGYHASMGVYIAYYYIGMFFNLVLPTGIGGDVVRVWYLANRHDTGPRQGRRTAALVSVMAERVNGLVVLILVACVAVIFSPTPLPQWISGIVAATGAAAVASLIGLPVLNRLFHKYPRVGQHPRLSPLRRLLTGWLAYRGHPGMLFAVTGLSVFVQVGNVVVWWLVGEALGLPVSPWYYGVLVPLVSLVGTFVPTIGGLGARELATVILLAPVNIAEPNAITLSLLSFLAVVVSSQGGLVFYLFGHFPRYDSAKANAAVEDIPEVSAKTEGMQAGFVTWQGGHCRDNTFRRDSDQGRSGQSPSLT